MDGQAENPRIEPVFRLENLLRPRYLTDILKIELLFNSVLQFI